MVTCREAGPVCSRIAIFRRSQCFAWYIARLHNLPRSDLLKMTVPALNVIVEVQQSITLPLEYLSIIMH